MTITLEGSSLTIEKLVAIARGKEQVAISAEAAERIGACRRMLETKLANREIMYGTNTGTGEFSEKVLSDEQVAEFQKYLIYNHAAGIGEPMPIEYVRAPWQGGSTSTRTATRGAAWRSRKSWRTCSTKALRQ